MNTALWVCRDEYLYPTRSEYGRDAAWRTSGTARTKQPRWCVRSRLAVVTPPMIRRQPRFRSGHRRPATAHVHCLETLANQLCRSMHHNNNGSFDRFCLGRSWMSLNDDHNIALPRGDTRPHTTSTGHAIVSASRNAISSEIFFVVHKIE